MIAKSSYFFWTVSCHVLRRVSLQGLFPAILTICRECSHFTLLPFFSHQDPPSQRLTRTPSQTLKLCQGETKVTGDHIAGLSLKLWLCGSNTTQAFLGGGFHFDKVVDNKWLEWWGHLDKLGGHNNSAQLLVDRWTIIGKFSETRQGFIKKHFNFSFSIVWIKKDECYLEKVLQSLEGSP